MKVAQLRCHGLKKYEMQSFEPLKDKIEIKAFSPYEHAYDLREIDLPIETLSPVSKIRQCIRDARNIFRTKDGNLYRKADFFLPQFEKKLCNYDIIHVNEIASKSTYVGACLKRKYGIKLVATVWENIPYFDRVDEISRFIFNIACPAIDLFIAPTLKGKNVLMTEGIPEEKIKIIYPGIDIERFTSDSRDENLKKSLRINKNDDVILFTGRFIYKKGIYTLCQAVREIKRTVPEINLKVIMLGTGPEESKLKQYIEMLELKENIIMPGSVSYKDIPAYYNLCDIFVLPSIPTDSWQEQFGFVFAEAMASGKPVVTTFTGSIKEVVDGGGIFVPPDDYISLSESIAKLLGDKNLQKALGETGRKIALSRYDSRKSAQEILLAYEDLLQDNR